MEIGESHAQKSNFLVKDFNSVIYIIFILSQDQVLGSIYKTTLYFHQVIENIIYYLVVQKDIFIYHSKNVVCKFILNIVVICSYLFNHYLDVFLNWYRTKLIHSSFIFVLKSEFELALHTCLKQVGFSKPQVSLC